MHLLGDSVDLDNAIHPTTYEDINNAYGDVSPLQLTTLVEEGVKNLQNTEGNNREDIDVFHPLSNVSFILRYESR